MSYPGSQACHSGDLEPGTSVQWGCDRAALLASQRSLHAFVRPSVPSASRPLSRKHPPSSCCEPCPLGQRGRGVGVPPCRRDSPSWERRAVSRPEAVSSEEGTGTARARGIMSVVAPDGFHTVGPVPGPWSWWPAACDRNFHKGRQQVTLQAPAPAPRSHCRRLDSPALPCAWRHPSRPQQRAPGLFLCTRTVLPPGVRTLASQLAFICRTGS